MFHGGHRGIFMRSIGNLHEILMTGHEDISRSRPPLPTHVRITTIDDNNYQPRTRGISISPPHPPFLSPLIYSEYEVKREKKRERERDEGKIGNHSAATWPYNGEKSLIAPLTTRNFNTPGLPVLRRLGQVFEAIDD